MCIDLQKLWRGVKMNEKSLAVASAIALLVLAVVVLCGCASSGQDLGSGQAVGNQQQYGQQQMSGRQQGNDAPDFGNRTGRPRGEFGNMTAEKSQQMFEQRTKEAAAACEGKAAGDSCSVRMGRGNETATCQDQNGALLCQPPMGGMPGGFNGSPPSR